MFFTPKARLRAEIDRLSAENIKLWREREEVGLQLLLRDRDVARLQKENRELVHGALERINRLKREAASVRKRDPKTGRFTC